jgi:carboxyl-terminal processing protease
VRVQRDRRSILCAALLAAAAAFVTPLCVTHAQATPASAPPVLSPRVVDKWLVGHGWLVGVPGARPSDAYAADTAGRPTDAAGGAASLRARSPERRTATERGVVSFNLLTDTLQGRRVRVTGEVRTRDVRMYAAMWLRLNGARGETLLYDEAVLFDASVDAVPQGTTDWTAREITVPVPAGTAQVAFGLLLRDGVAAEVRRLRLEVLPGAGAGAPMAADARAVLDSALALVRRHALWRDTVTWAVVEPEVRTFAAGAQSASEVYPAVRLLLARLGDRHSSLGTPQAAARQNAAGANNVAAEVRALPAGVGYVWVPGYNGVENGAMRAYAERMHAALAAVTPAARCGWVVDLRANTGGNMRPMFAGLRPFLGTAPVLSWGGRGAPTDPPRYAYVAGTGIRGVGAEPPALAALEQAYVAVLTGPRTASSGEAVAIGFRGRPRTRSFGAATAGLSTGNTAYDLPGGARLHLTTAVAADRTGTTYGAAVVPDELVPATSPDTTPGAPGAPGGADASLNAATGWLRRASGCGGA